MITRGQVLPAYGPAIPGAPPPLHFVTYAPPPPLYGAGHAQGQLSRARGVPPMRPLPRTGLGMDPADPATFTRIYQPTPGMFGRLVQEAGTYGGVQVQAPPRRKRRGPRE
jgi:hypothetical protein